MSDAETTRRVLLRAAEILEPEGAWCQVATARTAHGKSVEALSRSAVSWCVNGALTKAAKRHVDSRDAYFHLLDFLGQGVATFNDAPERTQAEVVQALRDAAASLPS